MANGYPKIKIPGTKEEQENIERSFKEAFGLKAWQKHGPNKKKKKKKAMQ